MNRAEIANSTVDDLVDAMARAGIPERDWDMDGVRNLADKVEELEGERDRLDTRVDELTAEVSALESQVQEGD